MKTADIVIVGTGSLAARVANALSQVSEESLCIAVIGRSGEKAARLALIANARAVMFGTRARFLPVEMVAFKTAAFSHAFRSLKPKVVFHTASLQSPWQSTEGQNGWTKLIASAGFGITLPLQLALAAEVSCAAGDTKSAMINASYPDGVNVVLERLGLPVKCGIGNAGIVEAFCRAHPSVKDGEVRVVGHHGHLSPWLQGKRSAAQPRVWVRNREMRPFALRPKVGRFGETLNQVTSSTAVPVILSLLSGVAVNLSIPGVAGLPGGYPFVLKNGKFHLRLPSGINREEAIAHNKSGEQADGLELGSELRFTKRSGTALAAARFEYAQGFAYAEWADVRDRLLALRERLRRTKT